MNKVTKSESSLGIDYVTEYSDAATYKKLCGEEMFDYKFRGKYMKRAPKREYYYPSFDAKVYKWGQEKSFYPGGANYVGKEMPSWMTLIADKINKEYGVKVNHSIVIKYEHGVQQHAPPHKDKVDKNADFFVLSFGTPRVFQILDTVTALNKQGKMREQCGDVLWEKGLEHCSLLRVSGDTNQKYYHAVPKDKHWKGSTRYSLIFRTIV